MVVEHCLLLTFLLSKYCSLSIAHLHLQISFLVSGSSRVRLPVTIQLGAVIYGGDGAC
jgi:hypothetical protein